MRPEYQQLARDFPWLAGDFGVTLPLRLRQDVWELTATVDCIDRVLDPIADHRRRDALSRSVLDILAGETRSENAVITRELRFWLEGLRAILRRHGVDRGFLAEATAMLHITEVIRTTASIAVYVDSVAHEGLLLTRMVLLLLENRYSPAFGTFFGRLGEVANLSDAVLDVREDYRRAEIAVVPSGLLYGRLLGAIAGRLGALWQSHPRWMNLVRWSVRYLAPQTYQAGK